MKHIFSILLLIILVVLPAVAQTNRKDKPSTQKVERELMELERQQRVVSYVDDRR